MHRSKARTKTAFVPRVVFRAAFAGTSVVPICVAMGCGNGGNGGLYVAAGFIDGSVEEGGDANAKHDASGFDGPFVGTVAAVGFGDASDGSSVIDTGGRPDGRILGVAIIGFGDAGDAREEDALSVSVTMMAFGDR
jgi:hypothetical protein